MGKGLASGTMWVVRARVLVVVFAVMLATLAIGAGATSTATAGQLAAAWGSNDRGQLGNGTSGSDNESMPVRVINLSGVTAIAAGGYHSLAK